MKPDIVAARAGAPRPVLSKHWGDARPYLIDLSPILRDGELINATPSAACNGLEVGEARARAGRAVEVRIGASALPDGRPFADYTLTILAPTTVGGLGVSITVRVHA